MEHRVIGLIISGCIIFVSIITIIVKYCVRKKVTPEDYNLSEKQVKRYYQKINKK